MTQVPFLWQAQGKMTVLLNGMLGGVQINTLGIILKDDRAKFNYKM